MLWLKVAMGITWEHAMGIFETEIVSEGKDIINNKQVSIGTTNPAKWVSCARYMGQLSPLYYTINLSLIPNPKGSINLTLKIGSTNPLLPRDATTHRSKHTHKHSV